MRRILVLTLALWALAPATAGAGGWATVGLDSTPDGLPAGTPWVVELEILQHGLTPLVGVEPAVVVSGPDGAQRRVAATPTGRPGVYRASVTFPTAGAWTYVVEDGFGRTHQFPPAAIRARGSRAAAGAPPAVIRDDGSRAPGGGLWSDAVPAGLAGILAAGAVALVLRRRPRPARLTAPSGI